MERRVKWYNNVACGKESSVNILRFSEVTKNANRVVINEFHTEWLSKTTINKRNWRSLMERGRMRGDHEDTHNTLKNRGFAAKHDYARTNPNDKFFKNYSISPAIARSRAIADGSVQNFV